MVNFSWCEGRRVQINAIWCEASQPNINPSAFLSANLKRRDELSWASAVLCVAVATLVLLYQPQWAEPADTGGRTVLGVCKRKLGCAWFWTVLWPHRLPGSYSSQCSLSSALSCHALVGPEDHQGGDEPSPVPGVIVRNCGISKSKMWCVVALFCFVLFLGGDHLLKSSKESSACNRNRYGLCILLPALLMIQHPVLF